MKQHPSLLLREILSVEVGVGEEEKKGASRESGIDPLWDRLEMSEGFSSNTATPPLHTTQSLNISRTVRSVSESVLDAMTGSSQDSPSSRRSSTATAGSDELPNSPLIISPRPHENDFHEAGRLQSTSNQYTGEDRVENMINIDTRGEDSQVDSMKMQASKGGEKDEARDRPKKLLNDVDGQGKSTSTSKSKHRRNVSDGPGADIPDEGAQSSLSGPKANSPLQSNEDRRTGNTEDKPAGSRLGDIRIESFQPPIFSSISHTKSKAIKAELEGPDAAPKTIVSSQNEEVSPTKRAGQAKSLPTAKLTFSQTNDSPEQANKSNEAGPSPQSKDDSSSGVTDEALSPSKHEGQSGPLSTSKPPPSHTKKSPQHANDSKTTGSSPQVTDNSSSGFIENVAWSMEQHREFVSAVFSMGLKHCSPSVIMEEMKNDSKEISRENIKSHLQKFRKTSDKSVTEFMEEYDVFMGLIRTQSERIAAEQEKTSPERQNSKKENISNSIAALEAVMAGSDPELLLGGTAAAYAAYSVEHGCPPHSERNKILYQADKEELPRLTKEEKKSSLGQSLRQVKGALDFVKDLLLKKRHGIPVHLDKRIPPFLRKEDLAEYLPTIYNSKSADPSNNTYSSGDIGNIDSSMRGVASGIGYPGPAFTAPVGSYPYPHGVSGGLAPPFFGYGYPGAPPPYTGGGYQSQAMSPPPPATMYGGLPFSYGMQYPGGVPPTSHPGQYPLYLAHGPGHYPTHSRDDSGVYSLSSHYPPPGYSFEPSHGPYDQPPQSMGPPAMITAQYRESYPDHARDGYAAGRVHPNKHPSRSDRKERSLRDSFTEVDTVYSSCDTGNSSSKKRAWSPIVSLADRDDHEDTISDSEYDRHTRKRRKHRRTCKRKKPDLHIDTSAALDDSVAERPLSYDLEELGLKPHDIMTPPKVEPTASPTSASPDRVVMDFGRTILTPANDDN